ncbi:MAG: DUF4268 domain-containing protein [Crocinitomicaceae bacterium]|jgi:hypothetical protein|nr:DUF4268 domain-containing protein [Crocinitomicaceae bacterium]MBK6950928.1 DUF4268 domain-containing protein [Crocinitomicaceae bacterium]
MFTKEEKKKLKLEFWSRLEDQMTRLKNPHGSKVNWMNYNTGINHLYFRMEADEKAGRLCIDLQFPDNGVREVYWDQFEEFRDLLNDRFKGKLIWLKDFEHENGKTISRIYLEKAEVNINNQKDWDKMHLFLKLSFVKLDEFWDEFSDVFLQLK